MLDYTRDIDALVDINIKQREDRKSSDTAQLIVFNVIAVIWALMIYVYGIDKSVGISSPIGMLPTIVLYSVGLSTSISAFHRCLKWLSHP